MYDAIPMVYYLTTSGKRELVPYHGREDMIKQMIPMRAKYHTFADFTKATFQNLLSEEQRKDALVLRANYLQSSYIENKGNGQFDLRPLPALAPVSYTHLDVYKRQITIRSQFLRFRTRPTRVRPITPSLSLT